MQQVYLISDDVYIVEKNACPCGKPTRVVRVEELRKWMRRPFPTFLSFFLYLAEVGREKERAAPSSLTASVPEGEGRPLDVSPRGPNVERVPRALLRVLEPCGTPVSL